MTTNLGVINPAAGKAALPTASGNAEQGSEWRRQAWMLQMERALLAANLVKVTPEQASALAPASAQAPALKEDKAASPSAGQMAAAAQVVQSMQQLAATDTPSDTPQQTVGKEANVRQAEGTAEVGSANSNAAPSADNSLDGTLSGGRQNMVQDVAWQAEHSEAIHTLMPAASSSDALLPLLASLPGFVPYAATAPTALTQNLGLAALSQLAPRSAQVALPRFGMAAEMAGRALGSEQEEVLAKQDAAKLEGEDYSARQMHVYQGADGIQAWIRDANLSQMRAQLVAQALGNELNAAGLKLKTLTVNGKKQGGAGGEEDSAVGQLEGSELAQEIVASLKEAASAGKK